LLSLEVDLAGFEGGEELAREIIDAVFTVSVRAADLEERGRLSNHDATDVLVVPDAPVTPHFGNREIERQELRDPAEQAASGVLSLVALNTALFALYLILAA
jgi:hypothetical protein